jgi:O-antigen ligase
MAVRLDPGRYLLGGMLACGAAGLGLLAGYEPRLAITAALGVAFVLVVFVDLGVGMAIFGFLGFVELVPSASAAVSVTKLAGLLLALAWLALITTQERGEDSLLTAHPGISFTLLVFIGWSALSITWSESHGPALGSVGRWALGAALYLVVYSAVRDRKVLRLVVMAFLAGAVASAIYGILSPVDSGAGARLQSSLLDPNELAAVMLAGVALSVASALLNRGRGGFQIASLAAGGFCVLALFLTASRGGLIALGIMMLFAIIVAGRWRLAVLVVSLLMASSAYVYLNAFAPQSERDRIQQVTRGETRSEEGRTTLWQLALREFEDDPIKGVGAGNFRSETRHVLLRPGELRRADQELSVSQVVHNSFLEPLAELGLVGLALFAAIILFSEGSLLVASRRFRLAGDHQMEAVALALAVALFGSLAADFFISNEYSKQLWLLLGLGPAVLAMARATVTEGDAGS